jgi:hypothetical protein
MILRGIAPHPLGGDGEGDLEARESDPAAMLADGEDLPEECMLPPNPRATAISLKILDCFAASLGLCHMYSMMFGLDITISGR